MVVLIMGILLGACGRKSAEPLIPTALARRGGPITTTGAIEPTTVQLKVAEANGRQVRFGDGWRADPNGSHEQIILSPDHDSLEIHLRNGDTYTFEAWARDASDRPLAFGTNTFGPKPGHSNSVNIDLVPLLGAAQLRTPAPMSGLRPGNEIHLELVVTPTGRPDLRLAASDYQTRYEVANGTLVDSSQTGVTIRAGDRTDGDLTVTATVSGLLFIDGLATKGNLSATLRIPFGTSLALDLTPPTIYGLSFDPDKRQLMGEVHDDDFVREVAVYDGPALLATTDRSSADAHGVPQISLPPGDSAFRTSLNLVDGDHFLSVIATDGSGNEAAVDMAVTVH